MDRERAREANRRIAENTIECLEKGTYKKGKNINFAPLLKTAKAESKLILSYEDLEIPESPNHPTTFVVSCCTTLQAGARLAATQPDPLDSRILVLNFASAKNPGGGFLKGAGTQEESLARSSGLYPCLAQHKQFYHENAQDKTRNYTDHVIYSPKVPVFKEDSGKPVDLYCLNFISSPAPNSTVGDRKTADDMKPIFFSRADRILGVGFKEKNTKVILGAWVILHPFFYENHPRFFRKPNSVFRNKY